MSSQSLEATDEDSSSARSTTGVRSMLNERSRDGSLALFAGGTVLASALTAVRKTKGRATATVLALVGAGLISLGVRQRRTDRDADAVETGADARRDEGGDKRVSDEAYSEAEADLGAQRNADESASVYQSASESETEPNPRGMSDRSDVDADKQGDEESDLRFVEGEQGDPHRETHLEDETAHDTRLHPESDDEPTEIDLSEAAMADEASEAAGPHPEQSYPAREGTDPEPTSEKAPERTGEGAIAPADSSDDEDDGDADAVEETEADDADERATPDDRSADDE